MSKKKSTRKPNKIEGLDADKFILRNADDIFLHQNGLWHLMEDDQPDSSNNDLESHTDNNGSQGSDMPF